MADHSRKSSYCDKTIPSPTNIREDQSNSDDVVCYGATATVLLANQLLSSLTYANNFNDNFNFVYHNYFKTTLRHIDILRTPTTGNQYVSRCIQAGFAATDAPPDTLPWPIDLHPCRQNYLLIIHSFDVFGVKIFPSVYSQT